MQYKPWIEEPLLHNHLFAWSSTDIVHKNLWIGFPQPSIHACRPDVWCVWWLVRPSCCFCKYADIAHCTCQFCRGDWLGAWHVNSQQSCPNKCVLVIWGCLKLITNFTKKCWLNFLLKKIWFFQIFKDTKKNENFANFLGTIYFQWKQSPMQ